MSKLNVLTGDGLRFSELLDKNPTDCTIRAIYADWLEEQGDQVMADWYRHTASKGPFPIIAKYVTGSIWEINCWLEPVGGLRDCELIHEDVIYIYVDERGSGRYFGDIQKTTREECERVAAEFCAKYGFPKISVRLEDQKED